MVPAFRPRMGWPWLTAFARKRPIVVGSVSLLLLIGCASLVSLLFRPREPSDTNPTRIHFNPGAESVEILGNRNNTLWTLQSRGVDGAAAALGSGMPTIVLADLDNDGRNEVVTTLWTLDDAGADINSLKVYSGDGQIQTQVRFQGEIKYLDRKYANRWGAAGVLIGDPDSTGRRQMFISWDCGRSPWVMTRHDGKGEEIGEFWHFGVMGAISLTGVNEGGSKKLVLAGADDVLDTVRGEFPAIAVLDPEKILGASKSLASPGFDLPFSDAELYYIKLPVSPTSKVLVKFESVSRLVDREGDIFSFWVTNGYYGTLDFADLEYIFSRDLKALEVKSTSHSSALHAKLVQEGKLSGLLDRQYLLDLRNAIRYWDGDEWIREAVRIERPALTKRGR